MHLFTSGVSPNRIAAAMALAAILSPALAAADGALQAPLPWTGPITPTPILGEAAEETSPRIDSDGKMAIVGEIFRDQISRRGLHSEIDPLSPTLASGPVTVADDGCFTEDIPNLDPAVRDRMRQASLMLVATRYYSDGSRETLTGTGTVIEADTGPNRLLTAAHVAGAMVGSQGRIGSLESVYAFDGDGRLVARLSPSYDHAGIVFINDQELVHDEAMVLAPTWFPSREMAESWNERGLEVSPMQGANLQFFTPENERSPVGSGYSGASVVDEEGRVIGLYTENADYGASLGDLEVIAPNTSMPESILKHSFGGVDPHARISLGAITSREPFGLYKSVIAVGPPLSSAPVLTALGVDPERVEIVNTLGEMRVFSAGYPAYECRLNAFELKDIDTAPYAETPDLHEVIQVDDPVIPAIPNFFAGIEAPSSPPGPAPVPDGDSSPRDARSVGGIANSFDPFVDDAPEYAGAVATRSGNAAEPPFDPFDDEAPSGAAWHALDDTEDDAPSPSSSW
jgi:hypothetical protein